MNSAQNFLMLACVAMQEGHADEAAQLFVQANKMGDMKEYLKDNLSGNIEAQTLVESLSTSCEQLNSISSEFTLALDEAFGTKAIVSESSDLDGEDDEDDLDLDLLEDEEDEEEFLESQASVGGLFRFVK